MTNLFHSTIIQFGQKRQEHAQKQKVTTERVKAVQDKNRSKKKSRRIIIMMIVIELLIQYNPSIQKYCYQQGPFD